jgi:hypothetical protein
MTFGSPAGIPGYRTYVLARVKGSGWCLCDGAAACDPVFIGSACWFRTKRDLVAALAPVRDIHVPSWDGCVSRMKPRPSV